MGLLSSIMVQKRWIVGFIAVVGCLGVLASMSLSNQWNPLGSPSCSDQSIVKSLLRSEKYWRDAVNSRHDFIAKRNLESFNPWGDKDFTVIWNLFAPTFDCPNNRQRVGGIGDGGKWLCGFEVFEETNIPCVVYSIGVGGSSSFEAEILRKSNCEIYAYDMNVGGMGPQINNKQDSRIHFQKIGLGVNNNETSNLKTLTTIMEENGHKWIDIFKMDVEGAEYEILDNILKAFEPLPFGQMQIEIHLYSYPIPNFYKWFERLEAAGLRPFSSEINLDPCVRNKGMPILLEYSFLNVHVNHALVPEEFVSELRSSYYKTFLKILF